MCNYLFGSQKNTQSNSNFGKKIENVVLLLTNLSVITSKWIRVNAANYINSNKSVGEIETYAQRMAHNYAQSQQYRKLQQDDKKIPIIKIEDIKQETVPILDDNIRRSNRNRSR